MMIGCGMNILTFILSLLQYIIPVINFICLISYDQQYTLVVFIYYDIYKYSYFGVVMHMSTTRYDTYEIFANVLDMDWRMFHS